MDKEAQLQVLEAALATLRPAGVEGRILDLAPADLDAAVELKVGGKTLAYGVEVKRNLRPQALAHALYQLNRQKGKALLVADYITPPMAEQLREAEVQFIDTAGNAYLKDPRFYVWVKGQKPIEAPMAAQPTGRAFQRTGLQVLFVLLCRPAAVNLPYRELAELAGVAHGTVGWVMPELPKLGFVVEVNKKRRLHNGERLLRQWVDAYIRRLRPRLTLGKYRAQDLKWVEDVDAANYGYQMGGEPAAARITHNLRPGTATFYGTQVNTRLLADYRLRPDPGGEVEIAERFWNFDGEQALVPDVLVYADLIATGDARCQDIADELYGDIRARFE